MHQEDEVGGVHSRWQ